MKSFWDERYAESEYAYGKTPNLYFAGALKNLKAGKILFPAEGEGRNAVYAAGLGWEVYAFDISEEGRKKALNLALAQNVSFDYQIGSPEEMDYPKESFDAVALIYAHFPADKKVVYHQMIKSLLKPGGIIIFEAFSKAHLKFNSVNENAGGPKNPEMLFDLEEIRQLFEGFEFLTLVETETELSEGRYHNGKSAVIRFMARKQ